MQTVVLGMHRSGTSALARILNLMGLYFGGENVSTGRSPENVKGFWERRDVRDLNNVILAAANSDWDVVSALDLDALSAEAKARCIAVAADIVLNLDAHRPWFVKEPRLCVLFPIWKQVLDTPFAIHIHRNPLEVAKSLEGRNRIPIQAGLALWEIYNIRALQATQGLPRHFLSYEELLQTPDCVVQSLHAFLTQHGDYALRLPAGRELSGFLDPALHRQRAEADELSACATPSQLALYQFLSGASTQTPPREPPPDCVATLREYEATVDLAERKQQAENSREQRTERNLELQLAIRSVELRLATAAKNDAMARGNALERKLDRFQDVRRDLAVANDRVATLKQLQQRLEHQVHDLRETGERVSREHDLLARDIAARRAETTALLRRWDAEIARRQVQTIELDEFIAHLGDGIRAWLGSRRWRLGDALLTLPRRLTFRRTATPILALLGASLDAHEVNKATDRQATRIHARLLDDMPTTATVAANIAAEAVVADSSRTAALNRMLVERAAALGKSAGDIAERKRFADELVTLVETLYRSLRWRLGNFLLSVPRQTLGRGRPATAADALWALTREYKRDAQWARPAEKRKQPAPLQRQRARAAEDIAVRPKTTTPVHQRVASAPLFPRPVSGDVDVVVCVHNALEHVDRCLESVLTRTTVPYRLIVVNDGSDAPTTKRLRELAATHDVLELIEIDGPQGYTCAANHGLRASTASNAVLLNSDTIVPRLWLEGMLECMASGGNVGIVGPLSNAASWQSVPERTDADGRWAVNHLPPGYNVDEYAELLWLSSKRRFPRVDFVNGFCFMVKRSVVERIGFLDEKNFPRGYGEENDYCIRAKDAGFELAIADHCFVYHAKSKSFGSATRDELAQAGGEALERKHGKARVDSSAEALKHSVVLAEIRATVRTRLGGPNETADDASANRVAGNHVLFILPVRGGSGGANSVVQEVVGMRSLGVDAKVATHVKYLDAFKRFYPEFLDTDEYFVFYDSDDDLMHCAAPFQVIIATLWSSPALIAPIAARWPDKLYVYYVQDYEPWFFADDDPSRAVALDSYTLIPDMILMAKTDWICRTVEERHGRPVHRVAPSLDHEVFYPGEARPGSGPVKIAAMVRPTTPRRGPMRTIRVLKDVVANCGGEVQVLLFGCETQHLNTYIARNAPELRLTRHFDSRGVLPRQRVADLLRESDIFVDLSDYQAFGRTGLEAMACGCAVVLPERGGIYEYAVHGENCVIVDTESDRDMTDAIQALATDAALRTAIADNAVKTAACFDIVRASVSEISVLRAAMAARFGCPTALPSFGRGLAPGDNPTPTRPPSDAAVVDIIRGATVQTAESVAAAR